MALPRDEKWLTAFTDRLATVYTFSSCMTLCDLTGDGDRRLIIGDLGTGKYNMRLKVYQGVIQNTDLPLNDVSVGVVAFRSEQVLTSMFLP